MSSDRGSSPPPPHCLPSLPFILVFFLPIQIHSADTCPISPSPKLLRVVVKAEKHGSVRYKAPNAIMAAFPWIFLFFPLSFSVLVLFLFHGMTQTATLSDRLFPLSSTTLGRGGVLPMVEEGFSLGLGPWPNVYIGNKDRVLMIVLSRPFYTMSDCKTFFQFIQVVFLPFRCTMCAFIKVFYEVMQIQRLKTALEIERDLFCL